MCSYSQAHHRPPRLSLDRACAILGFRKRNFTMSSSLFPLALAQSSLRRRKFFERTIHLLWDKRRRSTLMRLDNCLLERQFN